MTIQIIPFTEDLLPQAGTLLAQRHRRDRAVLPLLSPRFEDPEIARQAIQASLRREHGGGFAALVGGRLVAYLVGDMLIDNLWGRAAWVRTAGCAYDPEQSVEIIRDLYAALGERWVGYGVFTHFALVPTADPALVHTWFSLSFGIQQVHALASLAGKQALPHIPDGIEIRKAGSADRQRLEQMSDVIWKTQVKSPVWGVMMPETVRETARDWGALVDEEDVTVWLALADGETAGIQGYWPAESAVYAAADNLHIPEDCVTLSVAGTREGMRGRGISTLLTRYGLAQAAAAGYTTCETDWRSANLLASRFWPRQGFQPVMYRLERRVDARIAWAKGSAPV